MSYPLSSLADAQALVGRTFEKDGKRRVVLRVDQISHVGGFTVFKIVWKNPSPANRWKYSRSVRHFREWLDGATEVKEST